MAWPELALLKPLHREAEEATKKKRKKKKEGLPILVVSYIYLFRDQK